MGVRPAAVAGAFYPGDPAALAAEVQHLLALAGEGAEVGPPPKALIVPHAGYVYSGEVAARAYARAACLRGRVSRVVLAGPAHRVFVRGAAVASAEAFSTPLGLVRVDRATVQRLLRLPFVEASDAAHEREHALEVHLPFLQALLGEFQLVPVVVGDATAGEMATLFHEVWGGDETLVVASTDLSHFLPYREACARDRATADAILRLEPRLASEEACGARVVNGLLEFARRRHLGIELADLRNSGDTAGGRDRVVGYASFLLREPEAGHG